MDKRTCSHPDGCDQPSLCKGLCKKHYMDERAKRLSQEKCKNENCENPRGATGGYCTACYLRWKDYGDPNAGPPRRKRRGPSRKIGTRSEYHANHATVRKERGPAWQHACEHCGGNAQHWATIHGRSGDSPDDYMPLCTSCHWKYDELVNNLPDNTGSKRSPESRERIRQGALRRWEKPGERERMSRVATKREARRRAAAGGDDGSAELA